jgi:hypothetical protein
MQAILLRLSKLDQHLRSHVSKVVKTRDLASILEVHPRTVRRYVSILRGWDREIEASPEGLKLIATPKTDFRDYLVESTCQASNTEFLLKALAQGDWVLIRSRINRQVLEARPLVVTGRCQEYRGSTLIADVAIQDRECLRAFRMDRIECLGPGKRKTIGGPVASYERVAKVILGKEIISFAA